MVFINPRDKQAKRVYNKNPNNGGEGVEELKYTMVMNNDKQQ